MRFAIYGTGAVGGYYGARLVQAGEDVVFIARGANLHALKTSGLRVDSVFGNLHLPVVQASDNPAGVGVVDVIISGVKTFQVAETAEAMRPMVGPETMVITTQNGVDSPQKYGEILGMQHVLGATVKLFTMLTEPGHIVHAGGPGTFVFGEFGQTTSARAERLLAVFQRCQGVAPAVSPDIVAELWSKEILIGGFAGVGCVTRAPIGISRALPETRALVENIMREIYEVAVARGVNLPTDTVQKCMEYADAQNPANTSSTQRDVIAGRPSEWDSIIGAVLRMGREAGLSLPTLSTVYAAVLPQDLRARGEVQFDS